MGSFDDFNLEKTRLSQNYRDGLKVKEIIEAIPIRKSDQQGFIWIHSGCPGRWDIVLGYGNLIPSSPLQEDVCSD
jgi:hypothetical protein